MNTTKLRAFTLFILLCGLFCIASMPVAAEQGNFRVTLTGFRANQLTNEGLRASDGAGDEISFLSHIATVDAAGRLTLIKWDNVFSSATAMPPTILFEGEIIENSKAALIIPTIWEMDGESGLGLVGSYTAEMNRPQTQNGLGAEVAYMIRTPTSLLLDKYRRPGSGMGINNTMLLAGGIPQDRPIGMNTTGLNQFGFTPQALVLTYQAAEFISRTRFGFEVGVVPVQYVDASGMGGNYTLFLKVERTDVVQSCPSLTSTFTGRAELTIDNPRTPLPFTQDPFSLAVEFTECRSRIRINTFKPIVNVSQNPPNTSTITMIKGGEGPFDSASGALNIPIVLSFENTNAFLGNSTLSLVLTGAESSSGSVTLEGRGTFAGGGLNGYGATLRITGSFSPRPR